MNDSLVLAMAALALVAGGAVVWALAERARAARAEAEVARLGDQRGADDDRLAARAAATAQAMAEVLVSRATETFRAQDVLAQAKLEAQLTPVADTLTRFQTQVETAEKARAEASGGLKVQIEQLLTASVATQEEARKLSTALRRGAGVQGRWGEQMLRNVLEMAGLQLGIDFHEQLHIEADGEGALRPDIVVRMPGGGQFVIDAKCSLTAFEEAMSAGDDEFRERALGRHAASLRGHVQNLSGKAYWERLKTSPDFVAMFVPGDGFLAAALERTPDLMSEAMSRRVIVTTPTSLFGLCKAVAYGWRVEKQAQNATDIAILARELYKRLAVMGAHVQTVGKSLGSAVEAYNKFVGSLESSVLSQARRFVDLKVDHEGRAIPELVGVEAAPRPLGKLAPGLTAPALTLEDAAPTSPT
ncbi:MAG: DNA recombination protein RmuC [Caulobacteraceae bacterium]